jgi:hydroxymethylglutaryl-CoA lyase
MIRIVEVGPRDGLQNERKIIPTLLKFAFIKDLVEAGLKEVEVTSFVSPKRVPQLADAAELLTILHQDKVTAEASLSALVPNMRGLERALESGVARIAVFTAASESFNQENINQSIKESLEEFKRIIERFRIEVPGGWVRAYVSTAFGCPYSGPVPIYDVIRVCRKLHALGVNEISLGDTIGVAVPLEVKELTKALSEELPLKHFAYHFHDTRGTAVANVAEALEHGITCFDSSSGGLGGCPFAPGAGGNLATEDLVYFLTRSGLEVKVDLPKLAQASLSILNELGKQPASKVQQAVLAAAQGQV